MCATRVAVESGRGEAIRVALQFQLVRVAHVHRLQNAVNTGKQRETDCGNCWDRARSRRCDAAAKPHRSWDRCWDRLGSRSSDFARQSHRFRWHRDIAAKSFHCFWQYYSQAKKRNEKTKRKNCKYTRKKHMDRVIEEQQAVHANRTTWHREIAVESFHYF